MKSALKRCFVLCLLSLILVPQTYAAWEATKGKVVNNPDREEEFMDWGLGMFIHWSLDSQLGSVISHSMVGATDKYLNRFIFELPKTFNPKRYDPDEWMDIAKLAGVQYMVLTTKHHSGFCLWDSETTDFDIMGTPYKKDIVKLRTRPRCLFSAKTIRCWSMFPMPIRPHVSHKPRTVLNCQSCGPNGSITTGPGPIRWL